MIPAFYQGVPTRIDTTHAIAHNKVIVIDGEIVIATPHGLDFDALQQRLHPAESRVTKLSKETPASFVAFDLLALGDHRPYGDAVLTISNLSYVALGALPGALKFSVRTLPSSVSMRLQNATC